LVINLSKREAAGKKFIAGSRVKNYRWQLEVTLGGLEGVM
jgi:hypothetical protein